MSNVLFRQLLDDATGGFHTSGRFAYHYARGKLGTDPIFREILQRGLLTSGGSLLDLGCGQGSLFAWLLAANRLHEQMRWPADWPSPPVFHDMRGIELMQNDVDRAAKAFGHDHPVVRVEQGDMNHADFGKVDTIIIFDALHYFDNDNQKTVLRRIHASLPPGGQFLTRIGDASAGLPFYISNWVDHLVTFVRGHRLPQLYCRPLAEWKTLLNEVGFDVQSYPMSEGKPFANVMLDCHRRS